MRDAVSVTGRTPLIHFQATSSPVFIEIYFAMNMLVRTPNRNLSSLQHEIDRLFDGFFPTRRTSDDSENAAVSWAPRTDLVETPDAYRIEVDVPGVERENLHINFNDNRLTISGERNAQSRSEEENVVRVERSFGHFFRSFTLPNTINASDIGASYENGVLTVTVPKAEESKPRRIEVK